MPPTAGAETTDNQQTCVGIGLVMKMCPKKRSKNVYANGSIVLFICYFSVPFLAVKQEQLSPRSQPENLVMQTPQESSIFRGRNDLCSFTGPHDLPQFATFVIVLSL